MNNTKYTGLTLIYVCRNSQGLIAVQKSFITNVKTLIDLRKISIQFGKSPNKEIEDNNCKYLGIHDLFEINGPLKHGAILGRVVLWSYKTLDSAKKLLKPESQFWMNINKNQPSKQYIAEVVFLISAPIKYRDRRTVICNVLIEGSNKSIIFARALRIGKSQELKEKLFKVLLQYEPELTNELNFIGIANIKSVYDEVALGKCFESLFKKVRNVLFVKKLVFPMKNFIPFFKEMLAADQSKTMEEIRRS